MITVITIFSNCRKESDDPVLNSATSSSVLDAASIRVDAGPLRKIVYPDYTSIKLLGNGSGRGKVIFQWKQIDGNSPAAIEQPTNKTTNVSGLKPGVYTFTLTVTDRNGVSREDTTSVSVLKKMTWNIDGVVREALVHLSAGSGPAPVIFAFHGHGGTDFGFADKGFEFEWQKAIVVYPQGLPTKSPEDKEGKKPGWQHEIGEVNNHTNIKDQDLKFFDAMLSTLNNSYQVNSKELFVHGWSNGGFFIYDVLWPARGDKIAGLSTAAATLNTIKGKKTLPLIQITGRHDPLVSFIHQEQVVKKVRNLNKCSPVGIAWAAGGDGLLATRFWSRIHNPVVFLQYDGGHDYPETIAPLIVKFFRQVAWNNSHRL